MSEWLLALIVGSGVSVGVGVFAKLCPKEKLVSWLRPPCLKLGIAISKALILRLGKTSAERVEEGIIVTLLLVAGNVPLYIMEGLVGDNEKQKTPKEGTK